MRFGVSHLDQSNMKCRIVAVLILVAGYAMSSEPNGDDKQETLDLPDEIKQELKDLPDDIKQELMDLSDVDKQKWQALSSISSVQCCLLEAAKMENWHNWPNRSSWKAKTPSGGRVTMQCDSLSIAAAVKTVVRSGWQRITLCS